MVRKTKADLEREVRQLKEKAKFWEDIAESHNETKDDLGKKNKILTDKLREVVAHKNALDERNTRIQAEKVGKEDEIKEWKEKAIELNGLLESVQEERDDAQSQLEHWRGVASDKEYDAKSLTEELEHRTVERDEWKLEAEKLVKELENYKKSAAGRYDRMSMLLKEAKEENKEMKADWDADREYNEDLEGKLGELNETVTRLESELATANLYIDDVNTKIKQVVKDRKEMSDKRDEALEEYDVMLENRDKILQDFRVLESQNEEIIKTNQKIVKERDELKETVRKADEFSDKVVGELDELKKVNQDLTDIANQTNREKVEALNDLFKVKEQYAKQAEEMYETYLRDTEEKIEITKTLERDAYEVEIEQLKDELKQVYEYADKLKEAKESLNSELTSYMRKLEETQTDLKIKETSAQYLDNGLRSAQEENVKMRRANKNLLNYIAILASQPDSPNVPDNFTF